MGRSLEPNEGTPELSAAEHVAGGNVKVESRYFSCCRHDVDPAFFWTTLTVDEHLRRTRSLLPEDFPTKAVGILDLDKLSVQYDVSTYALTIAHNVETKWRSVAWQSSELILERAPVDAVLAYWTLEELCKPTPQELETFCKDDQRWKSARWTASAEGEEASAVDIISWAHWYELHDFVSGKVERPSWLPM